MRFKKQLEKRLPHWVEQGWVTPVGAERILDEAGGVHGTRYLSLAFAILGVLLFGSGVISFFAANWQEMSKLGKLLLLFGAMWASYAAAWWVHEHSHSPRLTHALLLLGVLLFGSNITLIAQIYHISAHYPDGVMWWALGGLLTAWLTRSQPAMVAALGLAVLWTGMEAQGFDRALHWPFLLFLAAALWPVLRGQWRIALHLAGIGLLLWCWFTLLAMIGYNSRWDEGDAVFLVHVYVPAFLALYVGGMLLARTPRGEGMADLVQFYAAFGVLASLYPFTFPAFLEEMKVSTPPGWLAVVLVAMALALGLGLWHRRLSGAEPRPLYLRRGLALLAAVLLLLLANLLLGDDLPGSMALLFNLVYLGGLLWLLYAAVHGENKRLVNMAFLFFALTLLARYFDTFWTLLDRSLFFMAGGVLVLGGGWWLEHQRRRLTGGMAGEHDGEGGL